MIAFQSTRWISANIAFASASRVLPIPLPAHLVDLFELPEHFTVLPHDLAAVQQFVATTFV